MDADESQAITEVLGGQRDSYRLLMVRHYPVAYRLAFRITGNAEDAEEAAQEAFLRAYQKLDTFRLDSNFSTWVNRIAMNTALNIVERRTRDLGHTAERLDAARPGSTLPMEVADNSPGPERTLLASEMERLRGAALEALTPMERAAFTLRHMEGSSIAEIAEALRMPSNAAKQAVFRAVSKLRVSLAVGGER